MKSCDVLYIVCFLSVLELTKSNYAGRRCIINSTLEGECKSIYNCPKVLSVFDKRPLARHVIENMKKIQCGFDKFTPLVCCSDDLNLEVLPSNEQTIPPPYHPRPTPTESGKSDENLLPNRRTCGKGTLNNKIYGGLVTNLDEFPWMVLLGYKKVTGGRSFSCGGALISKRYVLTAAHCVVGAITRSVGRLEIARLGEHNLDTNPDCEGPEGYEECAPAYQEITVEKSIAHKGYSEQNINRKDDIGLVRLSRNVRYSTYVQPICLPHADTELAPGDGLYVAGWGKTQIEKFSNVKLKVVLPVYNQEACRTKFLSFNANLTSRQLCAGGESGGGAKDACQGDSGGPLMKEEEPGLWVTMGVVSFGYGCGRPGWPGIYTKVSNYIDWINDNIEP